MINDEDKTLGMLSHLLGIFSGFMGPLIIFLVYNDKKGKDFIKENAKNALNFQLSMILYYISCLILMVALIFILIGFLFIPIIWALAIFALIVEIIGSIKASSGEIYKYPLAIPFIK